MDLCVFRPHNQNVSGWLERLGRVQPLSLPGSATPSTDITTISNGFDKRLDIHFGCSEEFQKPHRRFGWLPAQVFIADHVIAVLEIVLGLLSKHLFRTSDATRVKP
jgi:hypothetical protein